MIRRSAPSGRPWIHWDNQNSISKATILQGSDLISSHGLGERRIQPDFQLAMKSSLLPEIWRSAPNQLVEFSLYASEPMEEQKDRQQSRSLYWPGQCLSLLQ